MRRAMGALVAALAALLVVSVLGVGNVAAAPVSSSVQLSLTAGGVLSIQLNVTDPNGSALRLAMDGNFTILIDALPLNNTTRESLLEQIALLETTSPGLFGDHSGFVSAAEVLKFENLVEAGLARLENDALSSGVNVTLDGRPPISSAVDNVGFQNAEGAVTSSAPIYLLANLTQNFSAVGTGSSDLAISVPTIASFDPLVPVSPGPTLVSFVGPAASSISSVKGLSNVSTTNDLWGWAAPTSHGTFSSDSVGPVTFTFGPAFPWGDVVVVVVPVAAAVLIVAGLWTRRRRRRRAAAPPSEVRPSELA